MGETKTMIVDAILDRLEEREDRTMSVSALYVMMLHDCDATDEEVQDALIELEEKGLIEGTCIHGTPCARLIPGAGQ